MKNKIKCMKDLDLFQALDEEDKIQVMRLARPRSFNKGEIIFSEGDPADTIYLIKSGRVLLYKMSEDGKEIALDILQEDDIFGENTIFEDIRHTMNARALKDTFVCTCSRNDLPNLLKNPMIALKIIKFLGDKLNNYTEQVAAMAFRDVKGRVLNTMVRLAKNYGVMTPKGIRIDIVLNHQDLANLVNASRVMVTNIVNELKREGIIEVNQRLYYLLDQKLIEEVNRYA
ncbi:Crp/Fnr family transcriptional regulator [Thermincola potens]|uniref:Transcriptional regulator, Crp/Fnr family n=1 Tax=Thermincola potens (strain JR) TaxID=635013 RepID=D5X897_THEPJ|nr:Crp/Fnr family transcriptional regulator [Thermincola potens]ADG82817.1 transcriptional regulator, Crp/Fnr family [Thermincola potens JR]